MSIPTPTIPISLTSGRYNVLFSDDAERPQDLVVRDEDNIIIALTKSEVAQLYAIHHFLHDLGNNSSSTVGDNLFEASEHLTTLGNTLAAQHDKQGTNRSNAEATLDRAEIDALEDTFANTLKTAGLSVAQAAVLALVGVSATPAIAITTTILVLSNTLELLDAQLSKSKATEIVALGRHVQNLVEIALGQDGAEGLTVAKDLLFGLRHNGQQFDGTDPQTFSLDDFSTLYTSMLIADSYGTIAHNLGQMVTDYAEDNPFSIPELDTFTEILSSLTPGVADDAISLFSKTAGLIFDVYTNVQTADALTTTASDLDDRIRDLTDQTLFDEAQMAIFREQAESFVVQGTEEDEIIQSNMEIDVLQGGEGADTFIGNLEELDGDTITSFEVGDTIFVSGVHPSDIEILRRDDVFYINFLDAEIKVNTNSGREWSPLVSSAIGFDESTGSTISAYSPPALATTLMSAIVYNHNGYTIVGTERFSYKDVAIPTEGDLTSLTSATHLGVTAYSEVSYSDATISLGIEVHEEWVTLGPSGNLHDFLRLDVDPSTDPSETVKFRVNFDWAGPNYYGSSGGSLQIGRADFRFSRVYDDYFRLVVSDSSIRDGGLIYDNYFDFELPISHFSEGVKFILSLDQAHDVSGFYSEVSVEILEIPNGVSFISSSGALFSEFSSGDKLNDSPILVPPVVLTEATIDMSISEIEDSNLSGNSKIYGTRFSDRISDLDGSNFINAGDGYDNVVTGNGNDVHYGGGQNDTIESGGGNDFVAGGADNDRIVDGDGYDILTGNTGNDVIVLEGSTYHGVGFVAYNVSSTNQVGTDQRISLEGLVRIEAVTNGGDGFDTVQLSEVADAFFLHDAFSGFHTSVVLHEDYDGRKSAARFAGIEVINGMDGDDIIDLTSPDYSLAGSTLAINGGDGNDVIWGSDADETIHGNEGSDTIFGGAGLDELFGGAGADVFEFTRTSTNAKISDFDFDEGDRFRFYNTGDALFDEASAAITEVGFSIEFTDTISNDRYSLDISVHYVTPYAPATPNSIDELFEIV